MQDIKNSDFEIDGDSRRQPGLTYGQILLKGQTLSARWQQLCARFLPEEDDNSSWRYSHKENPADLEQGWKLHVSATILNACEILEKVAPFLISCRARFKAPTTLRQLSMLNSGNSPAYTQVGKFITVYPQTTGEALLLARRLDELTLGMSAPAVPFDLSYRPGSCVYYRYGAFKFIEIEHSNGEKAPAIRNLSGDLIPDSREQAVPSWLNDPFQAKNFSAETFEPDAENPLRTKYNIFRALRQRGKGGIYQAIDITQNLPRLCVVKEGRRHGEVGWDGSDGFDLVRREAEIMRCLEASGVNVPHLYSSFQIGENFYFAAEFIEGESLEEMMRPRRRRFSIGQILGYAGQIAALLAQIHQAGWIWRDCKPANLICGKNGALRPIDFESASRTNAPNFSGWRTIEFSAPENKDFPPERAAEAEDIYSLGAVIYFLLTGNIYQPENPQPIRKLRRGVPRELEKILEKLLVLPVHKKRPAAKRLAREFGILQKKPG